MDADAFRGFCLARAWLAGRDDEHAETDREQIDALDALFALPAADRSEDR